MNFLDSFISLLQNHGIPFVAGVVVTVATKLGESWATDFVDANRKRQDKIESIMDDVTNIISIANSKGYVNRPNDADKRLLFRKAMTLERLKKDKTAHAIRSFVNKWNEVYKMTNQALTFEGGGLAFAEDERRRMDLVRELDALVDEIIR